MAEVDLKKLTNLEALKELADRVNKGFATKTELKTVEDRLDGIVSQGGEPNVLEGVQVNETDLVIDGNKNVNIKITESETDGSIDVNDIPIAVHGLEDLAYKEKVAEDDLDDALQEKIDGKAESEDLADLENKVTTLINEDEGKSVRDIAVDELAKQLLPEKSEEALEALKKLADWIKDHPGEADEMNSKISALEELVGDIPEEATAEDIVNYITEVVNAAIEELNMGEYAKSDAVTSEIQEAIKDFLTEKDLNNMIATDEDVKSALDDVLCAVED